MGPFALPLAVMCASLVVGCEVKLDELDRPADPDGLVISGEASLGEEVYQLVCRRLAGSELPGDLDGSRSERICLGETAVVSESLAASGEELPERLRVLAELRSELVSVVDQALPDTLGSELSTFMGELLPFYDLPEERLQETTRASAAVMAALLDSPEAIDGLARMARPGMVPLEGSFGTFRAIFGYPRLGELLEAMMPLVGKDGALETDVASMVRGLALTLASYKYNDETASGASSLKDMLNREHPDFASGNPLWVARRDDRGLPMPRVEQDGALPSLFRDEDGDGLADVDAAGRFVPGEAGTRIPTPFAVFGEPLAERDAQSRAVNSVAKDGEAPTTEEPLYSYMDADRTMLRAALGEMGALFASDLFGAGDTEREPIAVNMARTASALFGERLERVKRYGSALYTYQAPDTDQSPVIDLAHASSLLMDQPVFDMSMDMTRRLLQDHEEVVVASMSVLLDLERRTRPGSDAYPEAMLAEGSTFWDDLLHEVEKVSRLRREPGDTGLEAMLRGALGLVPSKQKRASDQRQAVGYLQPVSRDERVRHQGAITAALLRFKDEFRGDPSDLNGNPVGGFDTRVDRSQPDAPVTCGKHGCAGQIKDHPRFVGLDFDQDGQTDDPERCLVPRKGARGTDCGSPANQSLFHRSMGLIWEMAGRSQESKLITVEELLKDQLLEDPCDGVNVPLYEVDTQACLLARQLQLTDELPQLVTNATNLISADYGPQVDAQGVEIAAGAFNPIELLDSRTRAYRLLEPSEYWDEVGGRPYSLDALQARVPNAAYAVLPGDLLDMSDVGRAFGLTISGDFVLKIPNPRLDQYLTDVSEAASRLVPEAASYTRDLYRCVDEPPEEVGKSCMSDAVDNLDGLLEFLSQVEGMSRTPDVSALTRTLFAPAGSNAFLVFDPLLVRGAPLACAEAASDAPVCPADDSADSPAGCCISNPAAPPLRYRMDTYYGGTMFAWEVPFEFTDGVSLTFNEAMVPLTYALNRHDVAPAGAGYDLSGVDPAEFESNAYLFAQIGKIVSEHWDSPDNPAAQDSDPNASVYRRFSNLVSYEELLADALDDGMLVDDPDQKHDDFDAPEQQLGFMLKGFEAMKLLLDMPFGEDWCADGGAVPGQASVPCDGLDVSADLSELMLNPHARCAGPGGDRRVLGPRATGGQGACDRVLARGELELGLQPAASRAGIDYPCSNDGVCYDGLDGRERRFISPLYLSLDSVSGILDRLSEPTVEGAWRAAQNDMIDHYAQIEEGRLANRRMRALMLTFVDIMRERWEEHRVAGDLLDWSRQMTEEMVTLIQDPVIASGLDLMEGLLAHPAAFDELTSFNHALLDDGVQGGDAASFRAMLAAFTDLVQLMPGDASTEAVMRWLAGSFSTNVASVVASGQGQVAIEDSAMWRSLDLTARSIARDDSRVTARVLANMVAVPEGETRAPMDALMLLMTEVNRVDAGARTVLSAADWENIVGHIHELLVDERRGFERMFSLVQCRAASSDDANCQ